MKKNNRPPAFLIPPDSIVSESVYEIVTSAAVDAGIMVTTARDIVPRTKENIRFLIMQAPFVIADVTEANPNVMYQVGFAQGENRPVLLVARSSRLVPFDLAGVPILIYDLSNPGETVSRLTAAMKDILENPDAYLLSTFVSDRENRQSVFISYSHYDREYLERLLVHLKPLERAGLIDLWVDTRLRPGDSWKKEIEVALDRSTVAVLLVSADFLASDFISSNELPSLLRKAEQKGTRIIPLGED